MSPTAQSLSPDFCKLGARSKQTANYKHFTTPGFPILSRPGAE